MKIVLRFRLGLIVIGLVLVQCNSNREENMENRTQKTTFADDLRFLQAHGDVVVLSDEGAQAQVIVSPRMQGKVMTSTATGPTGISFGWINYDLISSGKIEDHMNGYGGEDRLWLGPEGGQFSVFFTPGKEMVIKNWYTPKGVDTQAFRLLDSSPKNVSMETTMNLKNYSGTSFDIKINRSVTLLEVGANQ